MKPMLGVPIGLDAILYIVYTLGSVAGLVLLKLHLPAAKIHLLDRSLLNRDVFLVGLGAILYVGSFLDWMIILSRNDLSVAYPIAIGLTLVVSTLAAAALLNENLTPARLTGIAIVFLGVWLITRS